MDMSSYIDVSLKEFELCKEIKKYNYPDLKHVLSCSEINGDYKILVEYSPKNHGIIDDVGTFVSAEIKDFLKMSIPYFREQLSLSQCLSWWVTNTDMKLLTKQPTVEFCGQSNSIPQKGTIDSSGYDLCSQEEIDLKPGQSYIFDTGVKMNPYPYRAQIHGRSSMTKRGISVYDGIIDRDYRGICKVVLHNLSNDPQLINKGDKIAQLIFYHQIDVMFKQVDSLIDTTRGAGGFGSTGK